MNMFVASPQVAQTITTFHMVSGFAGIVYFLYTQQFFYFFIALLLGFFLVQVVHHVGLHRYFSHRSFEVNMFWHVVLCLVSPLICAGSPMGYSLAHRAHHAYSDSDRDPHSPKYLGFFDIVMFRWNLDSLNLKFLRSLRDPWIEFSHQWYGLIILLFSAALFAIDPLLIFAYSISLIYAKWCGAMTNYVCHTPLALNYRNFDTKDGSQNNLITGWIVGEWHNNHHADPKNWNQKVNWWEWDLAANIINMIKKDDKTRA
jgi:stearoyl-CoA desaturase (delta-9 desaturase)